MGWTEMKTVNPCCLALMMPMLMMEQQQLDPYWNQSRHRLRSQPLNLTAAAPILVE